MEELNLEKLRIDSIMVILDGRLKLDILKVDKVNKTTSSKQQPDSTATTNWKTKHYLQPGMAIPVQHLYWLKETHGSNMRIIYTKVE